MVTAAGSGYSRWRDLAVTRWREDVTRDPWGTYVFLRDVESGAVWSAGYQPTGVEPDSYEVDVLGGPRRVLPPRRLDRDRRSRSSSRPRTTPRSAGSRSRTSARGAREIELTSYAEIVLAPPAADAAHPAFSNLFVQTEFVARARRPAGDPPAALAGRSRRSGRRTSWRSRARPAAAVQYETDRARFLGRGRGPHAVSVIDGRPALEHGGRGARSDLQPPARVRLAPGETRPRSSRRSSRRRARRPWPWPTSTATPRRSSAPRPSPGRRRRSSSTTSGSSPTRPTSSSASPAGSSTPTRRCGRRAGLLARNERGAPRPLGPRDLRRPPIVLVRIDEPEDLGIVRQLLRAHEYWRLKGLAVDLVILNEQAPPTPRTSRRRSRPWSGRASRALAHERHEPARAASSSCAGTCSPPRTARCSRPPRAPCC